MKFDISVKWRAVGMFEAGKSRKWISRFLRVPKRTVDYWIKCYVDRGSVCHKKGAGRPKKSTDRSNRLLVRLAKRHRFSSAARLLGYWQEQVSVRTVYRRLLEKRIKKYRVAKKPKLSEAHVEARKRWALSHSLWHVGRNNWRFVVWSDESRFSLFVNDGRIRVWREKGERFKKGLTFDVVQGGGGSVHVWGGFWYGGRSELQILNQNVTGQSYCIILQHFLDSGNRPAGRWYFQHDNASSHRSLIVQDFLVNRNITLLAPWPARSPDMNPIEHVWDYIGQKVNTRDPPLQNLNDLRIALQQEWLSIPQDYLNKLVDSLPRRVVALLEAKGYHTRY